MNVCSPDWACCIALSESILKPQLTCLRLVSNSNIVNRAVIFSILKIILQPVEIANLPEKMSRVPEAGEDDRTVLGVKWEIIKVHVTPDGDQNTRFIVENTITGVLSFYCIKSFIIDFWRNRPRLFWLRGLFEYCIWHPEFPENSFLTKLKLYGLQQPHFNIAWKCIQILQCKWYEYTKCCLSCFWPNEKPC